MCVNACACLCLGWVTSGMHGMALFSYVCVLCPLSFWFLVHGLCLFVSQADSSRSLDGVGEGDEGAAEEEGEEEEAVAEAASAKPDLGGGGAEPPAPKPSLGATSPKTKPDLGAGTLKAKPDLGGKKPML